MNFSPRTSLAIALLVFSINFSFSQQDYYWVEGSGNWSDLDHWATTSGGSTKHTTLPTSLDDVFFDMQSFNGSGQIVTIDVMAACRDFDWTGATNFPALNASDQIDVHGSLVLNTDVEYNFDDLFFKTSSAGQIITTNGASFGSSSKLWFDGTGGWSLDGTLEASFVYFLKGTFNTDNFNITVANTIFVTSVTGNLLDLSLGSSTIRCTTFRNSSASDLVFDAGTSEIITNQLRGDLNGNGPFTYYNITYENGGSLYNNNTINSVTLNEGTLLLESGATQTISQLVINGDKFRVPEIKSFDDGSAATFSASSGTVTIDYVRLKDIHATGGATFNATNSVDLGNNTGWNFTVPASQDYYWVGNGGEWDDPSHWATSSGGSTLHTDYPGRYDNVFFDANSFSLPSQTVNVGVSAAESNNMDWTGVTNNPRFFAAFQNRVRHFGTVRYNENMQISVGNMRVLGDGVGLEFYFGGGAGIQNFTIQGTGEYSLFNDVDVANFSIFGGTVDLGNITVNALFQFTITDLETVSVDLGNATINTRNFNVNIFTPSTIGPGTSQITVTQNFSGDGYGYNDLVSAGNGTISGSNSFSSLTVNPGVSLSLEEGSTQTIGDLILTGSKASPINFNSASAGTQATVSVSSGTVNASFLVLQDIAATGGATFNADQTIDNGNNSGWNITPITGQDYYWVGGSGNWSDFANHWATTSGGSTFHTGEPGVLDNVFLDANSFNSDDDELTIDFTTVSMNDLDMSGMDDSASIAGDVILNIYGSLDISPIAGFQPDEIFFLSDEAETISAQNPFLYTSGEFHFDGTGSFTLTDSLLVRELNISNGTFNTDGFYVNISFRTTLLGDAGLVMNLGTSEFISRSLTSGNASNYTIDASNATLIFSSNFSPDFSGLYNVFLNDLIIRQLNSTDDGRIDHDITVNNLIVEAGSPITIRSGRTVTANQIEMMGTSDDPIFLSSSIEGQAATITQSTGTVNAEFLEIRDNIATGGAVFNAFNSVNLGNTSGWVFSKTEQTIDFPALADVFYDSDPFAITATASSNLEVEFEVLSGPAAIDGSIVTLDGTVGTVEIKASQPGDIDFFPAPSIIVAFEVIGLEQEIVFPAIDMPTYGDQPIPLMATSTQDLKITYESDDESVISINDQDQLVIHRAGEAIITALQNGNDTVSAATPVQQLIQVGQAPMMITAEDQTITFGDPIPQFSYTINGFVNNETENELTTPPVLSSDAMNGSVVGEYAIVVENASADNYDIAFIEGTLTIEQLAQEITFDPPSSVNLSEGELVLDVSINSGLDVSIELLSGPATLQGASLTLNSSGELVIRVTQSGDQNHLPATTVTRTITVIDESKTDQSISFDQIPDGQYGDTLLLNATATSGLVVNYQVTSGPAVMDGTSVIATGVGSITVEATQSGDDTYNPAVSISQSFESAKATLTAIAENKTKVFGDPNPALTLVYEGFINEDNESDIAAPELGTLASVSSEVGIYEITVSGGFSELYDIVTVNGQLEIEKAVAVIVLEDLEQIADGTERVPEISTNPAGLSFDVTYNGSPDLPVEAGSYEVLVTISDKNYRGEQTAVFLLNSALSAPLKDFEISVYPNPTTNFLKIKGIQQGEVRIVDLLGQTLMRKKVAPTLQLEGLAAGIYLVQILDKDLNNVKTVRLIKEH